MLAKLLLIFIVVTLAEMLVLLRVGAILQLGPTLALIVLTGLIGASLAKRQGLRILTRINAEMEAGRLPTAELADGALVLLAGAVLITPGFLTDLFGLALLVPFFRARFRRVLVGYFQSRLEFTTARPTADDELLDPAVPQTDQEPPKYVRNQTLDDT